MRPVALSGRGKVGLIACETLGWSLARAADEHGFGRSKLRGIENGTGAAIDKATIRGMLSAYAIVDGNVHRELVRLLESRDETFWWERYGDGVPLWAQKFIYMEMTCATMRIYESEFVTGILQTDAYLRAIHERDHVINAATSAQTIEARRRRREEFARRDPAPAVEVILSEQCIRRAVGGTDVMTEQIAFILAEAAQRPNLDVRILPFSAGAHASMSGSYTVFRFEARGPVAYSDARVGCRYDSDPASIELYDWDFQATKQLAVPVKEFLS